LTRLARFAICPSSAAAAAMRLSIAERMRDEKQFGSAGGNSDLCLSSFAAIAPMRRPRRSAPGCVSDVS
jgi:hypothetical protein